MKVFLIIVILLIVFYLHEGARIVHMYVFACVGAPACVWVCMQRLMFGIISNCSSTSIMEAKFPLNPEITDRVSFATQKVGSPALLAFLGI